jgi:hypothetical protein
MAVAGSAAQQGTGSRYSPIESAFGTSHTVIISGLPTSSPIHYCVISKDVAGNSAYSNDQTIDMTGAPPPPSPAPSPPPPPAPPPPPSSLSPYGNFIRGLSGGGGTGTLNTAYGTVGLAQFNAPEDSTHAGAFCMPTLNGSQLNPVGFTGEFGYPSAHELRIAKGGNLYAALNAQLWSQWVGYAWVGNNGADFASGPAATPVPGPLPTFTPPYTPSADGSSISGGRARQTPDEVTVR